MRKFLVVILLLIVASSLSAQYKDGPMRFTLGGGGSLCWLFSDNPDNVPGPVRVGGETEFHFDYFFESHIAFSTGVIWSSFGGNMVFANPVPISFITGIYELPAGTQLRYRLQYVEIPLGLKLMTREIGYTSFFSDFGINLMKRIEATGDTSDGVHQKNHIFKEVSQYNVGYHAELGINYSFGNKTSLVVAVFYKNTFLDFTTDYLDKPHDNSRINQAGIKIGFGF